MTPADRERIVEILLENPPRSYRAVSRATGYSDWTIRRVARQLDGDPRPMKQRRSQSDELPAEEISPWTGWLVFGGVIGFLALATWAGARWIRPPEA